MFRFTGTFRLYFLAQNVTHGTIEEKTEKCRHFIFSEIQRKKNFLAWQETWNKNNASLLKLREEELKAIAEKEEEAQKKRVAEQADEKVAEKVIKKGPQPGDNVLIFIIGKVLSRFRCRVILQLFLTFIIWCCKYSSGAISTLGISISPKY